jgi:2-dehydropantoate 2-reductase
VYGSTYGDAIAEGSEQNRCFIAAMREAKAVANAEGIPLTEDDLTAMVDVIGVLDPAGMPSMAQDRVNRKKTEVALFAGTIIERAEKYGIHVPQNRWLYQRVREIEASW